MKPLADIIEALRRELKNRRATVALQCVAIERSDQPLTFMVLTSADEARWPIHTVTIELGAPVPAAGTSMPPPASEPPQPVAPKASSDLSGLLTQLFGEPGFDNAARASVFREIIESLGPDQVKALVDHLATDRAEVPVEKPADAAVAMARTRLVRLLKLGPSGFPGGIEVMRQAFAAAPISTVLETITQRWKSQSDWINTTPPGVTFGP